MTPDPWEPVSRRSAWCPDCRTWSAPMPDPDEAVTWRESHDCQPARAAA